jgi:hypothetical protein
LLLSRQVQIISQEHQLVQLRRHVAFGWIDEEIAPLI